MPLGMNPACAVGYAAHGLRGMYLLHCQQTAVALVREFLCMTVNFH